jgi:glucosamine-6-phosphate deaminase
MTPSRFTPIEKKFIGSGNNQFYPTNFPYIIVDNFPLLGFLTAVRFLEWVSANPTGVVSLPTGKTPEFFIVWTVYLLNNWDTEKGRKIREEFGLGKMEKPVLKNLRLSRWMNFIRSPPGSIIVSATM